MRARKTANAPVTTAPTIGMKDPRKTSTATGSASGTYKAYVQECYVVPSSYGGDTSGYQIPFTVHYTGEKLLADYTPASGSTAASIALVTPST
jgi:hypothetical protein